MAQPPHWSLSRRHHSTGLIFSSDLILCHFSAPNPTTPLIFLIKSKWPDVDWKCPLFSIPCSSLISQLSVMDDLCSAKWEDLSLSQTHPDLFFLESFPLGFSL